MKTKHTFFLVGVTAFNIISWCCKVSLDYIWTGPSDCVHTEAVMYGFNYAYTRHAFQTLEKRCDYKLKSV